MIPESFSNELDLSKRYSETLKLPPGVFVYHGEGKRRNIFWIQTLSLNLAKEFGKDQPFVFVTLSFKEISFLGDKPQLRAIAAHLLQKILATQKTGPYIIGGVCVGSIVAFEIASQLKAAGHDVSLLALLDAPNQPYLGTYKKLGPRLRRQRELFQLALQEGPREVTHWLFDVVIGRLRQRLQAFVPGLQGESVQEIIETAAISYHPEPYQGNVLLLLPLNSPPYLNFLPSWKSVVSEGLHVEHIDGPHRKFITLNNAKSIASTISTHLPIDVTSGSGLI